MDQYPKELIEGVSPLIFTVDAVLNKNKSPLSKTSVVSNAIIDQQSSVFDLFYNGIASQKSIKDQMNSEGSLDPLAVTTTTPISSASPLKQDQKQQKPKSTTFSYFKSLQSSYNKKHSKKIIPSSKNDFFSNAYIIPVSNRHAFPPSKDPTGNQNQNVQLSNKLYKSISTPLLKRQSTATSSSDYSINNGIGSDASGNRNVRGNNSNNSSSNNVHLSPSQRKAIYDVLSNNPIQGILPSGWIEKHVYALPSTLLFVTELDITSKQASHDKGGNLSSTSTNNSNNNNSTLYDQALLEQHLLETVENITSTMAKKRDAPIHVVVLVKVDKKEDINMMNSSNNNHVTLMESSEKYILAQERVNSIKSVLRLNTKSITMLHYHVVAKEDSQEQMNDKSKSDKTDNKINMTMEFNKKQFAKLQQNIYENSNLYYLTQARRFKRKYATLHHDKIYDLLPLAIRYCVKIAIFYEFQCCSLVHTTNNTTTDSKTSKDTGSTFKEEEDEKIKRDKSIKYWKEAYKNVVEYYNFLIGEEIEGITTSDSDEKRRSNFDQKVEKMQNKFGEMEKKDGDQTQSSPPPPVSASSPLPGGVEVALNSPSSGQGAVTIGAKTPKKDDNEVKMKKTLPKHSDDMIHQCRAVADWLNIKILILTMSKTNGDIKNIFDNKINMEEIIALGNQVKKHSQVFLSKPSTLSFGYFNSDTKQGDYNKDPIWYFWRFIVHQRQVLSEFMEHHVNIPMNILAKILKNESQSQFSAAKHYAATGESLIQLGQSVMNEVTERKKQSNIAKVVKRANTDINTPDNRQRYVGSLNNAELSELFDEELSTNHEDIALGSFIIAKKLIVKEAEQLTLVTNKQPDVPNTRLNYFIGIIFMKQEKFEDAIESFHQALKESGCFPTLISTIEKLLIECYRRIDWKSNDTKDLLSSWISLLFKKETTESFSNFIMSSFVDATISGNLQSDRFLELPYRSDDEQPFAFSLTFPEKTYAVEGDVVVALIQLRSNLKFEVQIEDLIIEPNIHHVKFELRNKIQHIILKPNDSIEIPVKVTIPSNLTQSSDSRLVQLQALKSARANSCGFTKVGGGVYSTVKENTAGLQGGLCVGCNAIQIRCLLQHYNLPLNIKIHNTHRGSSPNPDKIHQNLPISTEPDNYIYSAWSRPSCFSMSKGPRCLRVLCPQSYLEITDVTTGITGGRVIEGTVNRILLRLKAAPTEDCRNVKMSIMCKSSMEKESKSLLDEDQETHINSSNSSRNPVLVNFKANTVKVMKNTIDLPDDWLVSENNQGQGAKDDWKPLVDDLKCGESTYAFFDLYRSLLEHNDNDHIVCKTNFLVRIAYHQVRPNHYETSSGDLVIQEYRGSVKWCSPLKANICFSPALSKITLSGNRHHVNNNNNNTDTHHNAVVVKSGEKTLLKCSIEAPQCRNSLPVRLLNVKFEPNLGHENVDYNIELIHSTNENFEQSNLLFSSNNQKICEHLNTGTKVDVVFAVKPSITGENLEGDVPKATRLGAIVADWSPIPLIISGDKVINTESQFQNYHGPLPIQKPRVFKVLGPSCYMESTPFEAIFKTIPASPKTGIPFEVRYEISNKTCLHQRLRVLMNDSDATIDSNNILVSGIINSEIILGPLERKVLSYSILSTNVGQVSTPAFDVSSVRYNSWIVRGSNKIFVSP